MGFDDKGPWSVADRSGRFINSEDIARVRITIGGDFGTNEERYAYAQGLAEVLNKYCGGENNVSQ